MSHETEPGYELIDQFHAEFQKRIGASFPEFGKGNKAIPHNGKTARIVFVDTGGSVTMGDTITDTGGPDGDIASDSTSWDVHIWGPDRKTVIELHRELIRAMRDVMDDGTLIDFGNDYTLLPVGEVSRGRKLEHQQLVIKEPIPARTSYDFTLVPVEHFETVAGSVADLPQPTDPDDPETLVEPTYQDLTQDFGADQVSITQDAEE